MPFIPLHQVTDPSFPRVSREEQQARDATAEQIVADELATGDENPDTQAALESEYRQRFGEPAPVRRGFIPLAEADVTATAAGRGFVPLQDVEPEKPSLLKTLALENPATATGEAALNLLTQGVALPVAGLAGIGAIAGKALGLTDRDPADVVHAVGNHFTYAPRGEFGKAAAGIVMAPFEKLAELGGKAGTAMLEATGSPAAATAVDTAIQALPMAIVPAAKGARAAREKFSTRSTTNEQTPKAANEAVADEGARQRPEVATRGQTVRQGDRDAGFIPLEEIEATAAESRGFIPLDEVAHDQITIRNAGGQAPERVQRMAEHETELPGSAVQELPALRSLRDNDLPGVDQQLQPVPGRRGAEAEQGALAMPDQYDRELRAAERNVGTEGAADAEAQALPARGAGRDTADDPRGGEHRGDPAQDAALAPQEPRTARYALIEADNLVASHDVDLRPVSANPFGRQNTTRHENEMAIQGITKDFEPARLIGAADDAAGAPIVAHDGVVEAGHRRAIAVQRVYQANGAKADAYRAHLREQAPQLGLDPAAFDGMKKPVLVRLPDEPAPRMPVEQGATMPSAPVRAQLGEARGAQDMAAGHKDGAFANWFGKSHAVDAEGKPLLVYHATTADIAKFDRGAESIFDYGRNKDSGGIFFTSDHKAAEYFTRGGSGYERGANIIPAYIRLENPIKMRAGMNLREQASLLHQAEAAGHDGAIIGNSEYVVFHPGQAKSVFNRGAFSREDSGLLALERVQNGTWNPGAQYTPFVDQVRAPTNNAKTVADLPAPIRREQIINDFAKALGTTVYEGRVKGKKRLGFFRPSVEEVRTKRAADIEVAAHEVAHLLDHRVKEISTAWRNDKALREELKSVSYDQKSVSEGFAEGMRLFLTQPETLQAKAPKVHAWLTEFADSHAYGPALRQAQTDMTAWFGQDALNRARSKIGTEKPMAEFFDGFWGKFRQSTVDDLHGVYRMERDLTGKINPNGPYESSRLSRASASIADGAVRFGHPVKLPDGSFKFAGKGLEDIMKPVAEKLDDALLYFVGRSARELHGQGREHLFTTGEIEAMQRLRTPERDKAFAEYQEWNRGVLDFAEAQGIINPESRRLWQRTQYLPFHRVEQPGGLKGKPGDWSGVQALTGGTTNIRDVLGNMVGNAAMLIDKAVKNEARRKIANLSQQEGGGKFMVKIEPGERMVKIGGDQVLGALLKKYGIAMDGDAPAFFEFLIKGQPPGGNNVVAVLQGGKPIWFEVGDPLLMRALQSIDRPVQSEVVKWLGLPKRIGQTTITATADFWLANIARDTIMGSVMSRAGFRPILDSLDGMRMRMTKDPVYREWVANGGGLSSIYLDEAKLRTKLERFYGRQGIDYRTVMDSPDKLLTMIETLGDAFESSTRLGEYKRARQRGENPRHAAYLARESSTDFAAKGDSKALGFLYDTVMFLRPALVSWDRLARGLAHDPNRGAIAAKAGTLALASAGLYLLNKDDPRYADLPDWDRDANWHFFVGEHHFRYPKIWEIGAMASAAERSVEKIMAEDPAGLGKDFARIVGHTFSVNWMPQIMAPLADQAANRNAFTKAPIETPGMENLQPFLRAKPGTSETMKAAGMATRDLPESMQINPARAEALLRGYFNTFALYGLMVTDQAFFGDKLPEKRADELPVVRRFYANEPAKHTKYESTFYDLLQESKRLRGTMRELDEMNLRGLADEKERSPLAGEAKPLERAAKNLSGINNDMQAVRRDDALTPAEKRQRLDGLTVERNALMKAAVTESKAAQRAKTTPADVVRRGLPKDQFEGETP